MGSLERFFGAGWVDCYISGEEHFWAEEFCSIFSRMELSPARDFFWEVPSELVGYRKPWLILFLADLCCTTVKACLV